MSSDEQVGAIATGAIARGAIALRHATKTYDRSGRRSAWRLLWPGPPPEPEDAFRAVDNVDLSITPGAAIGLIGANGAGKSTVLKLIAGVVAPNSGVVRHEGRVGSMIELGLGFHPELTGWENVWCSAGILGLSTAETEAAMDDIVEFAGIEEAMGTPLKHYSTGMKARLGFAVATQVDCDILLVDEVLAVGDKEFQARCLDRIGEMQAQGTTLVFVSHELWLVDAVCERVLHVNHGRVVDDGLPAPVIARYVSPKPSSFPRADSTAIRFDSVEVSTPDVQPWSNITLAAEVVVEAPVDHIEVVIEYALAAQAPDRPIATVAEKLPGWACVPGRHRLVGTTSPIPLDSGSIGVNVSLIDTRDRTLLDVASCTYRIGGKVSGRQARLVVRPQWELFAEPAEERVRPQWTPGGGQAVARAHNLKKEFRTGSRRQRVAEARPGEGASSEPATTVALDRLSLEVFAGEVTGIIGPNGAGKSTFLRLLAGVTRPTGGTIWTRGRLVSMLDLGIGFHPDLTGLENLRYTSLLLGLTSREVTERIDEILEFADIGDAVDMAVKRYSSGMRARLGLAIALHADADLLLIDEVLAVGDEDFRKKAVRKAQEIAAAGAGVVFVSHDLRLVERLCHRVVRIDKGAVVDDGAAVDVLTRAGGAREDAGTTQIGSAIRLEPLQVQNRHVNSGERLEFSGVIEVAQPCPTVRLDLSYRAKFDEHPGSLSREDLTLRSFLLEVVEEPGGVLSRPGRYRYRGMIDRNEFHGACHVTLTAVEERDGMVLAETWQDVTIGLDHPGDNSWFSLEVEWTDPDAEPDISTPVPRPLSPSGSNAAPSDDP